MFESHKDNKIAEKNIGHNSDWIEYVQLEYNIINV
jgi:hypothetical protein